ncbi:zinc-binding alcohol dehydrogenase family protein [Roseiconus lacunae]|uniref:Zinc-type alcohol dehydrogenase-like protein n=1 Tax=Roseiconus lacunae TaxID=2605694 RepID=A0ABT7PR25_9BACT|nr:zinc-binding alcohol dehydrogenase family protein [Roseiconus lacunae]MDM4018791.1 zinc-binding alcohol dehydrogenase family protein [Roseiconus lacunae]WRQ50580.1 zinc-binding alcohol dehydrogenase family protein [Stieleria sp. HD01]
MKAVALTRYLPIEDPLSLFDIEMDRPEPVGHDLLVAVNAIAVNPVDYKVRAPKDKIEESPKVLGWDAAGVVEAVGPEVTLFKPGDEVFYAGDITRQGTNSQFHLVEEAIVGRKPQSLDFAQAAAFPLTSITAYEAFFDRLGIDVDGRNAKETLLIIGGAGGVGSIGIQLAKLAGLTVIATASRPESIQWVRDLGADHVINHREPLRPQIESLGLSHVDHIALFNDTDGHWDATADLIRPQGKVVSIVENERPLSQSVMKSKSASLTWEFMFTRSMFQTPDRIEQHHLLNRIADWIDAGKIKTTANNVVRPINAENLRAAHKQLEAGRSVGKIVLEGWH